VLTNRTKIVATVGPASWSPPVLRQLIDAGVDVFRLNFSHGTHDEHSAILADIRAVSREMDRHVAVLQDLCGPKMRLEPIPGDVVECRLDDEFTLVTEPTMTTAHELMCSYRELPNDLRQGEAVLFADGTVAMTVTGTGPGAVRLRVTLPGRLRSRQGLNLPGSDLAVSALTDKDLSDLDWTARHAADVDFVGLSFARRAEDVARLRRELEARQCVARVVVKIEKPQAVEHLESIVAATDAVMVARGDLGVEMDVQRVPAIQKRVIALCNQVHRPVITATQMLNSMEHSSRPTRAEASDVFNAVLDGTDAVMLSGETAVGEFPFESVAYMDRIARAVEPSLGYRHELPQAEDQPTIGQAMSNAACDIAEALEATALLVPTFTGRTASAVARLRPRRPIIGLTHHEHSLRHMALEWGVTPVSIDEAADVEELWTESIAAAKRTGIVEEGDRVVLTAGTAVNIPGSTNVIKVEIA
jgi:pyruvate kinase